MQGRLGIVLGVVGIVLALVGFVGPWWSMNFEASALGVTIKGTADFQLFGGTATMQTPAGSQTNTSDYKNDPQTGGVFLVAAALTAVALIVGIGMVGLAVMSGSRPQFRKLGAIAGILAFVLALFAALYVMAQLPSAVTADSGAGTGLTTISGFWGSQSSSFFGASASFTYGAGWAWYAVLVGAIVFLIGGLALFRAPAPMPMPAVQPPPPMPPSPP